MAAQRVGQVLQFLKWNAFKPQYAKFRTELVESLDELGIEVQIPRTIEEFEPKGDEILHVVHESLTKERSHLGGDVYALSLFYFGYVPFELVLSAAWKSENYEPLLWLMKGVLADFGIESEYDGVKEFVDLETRWLADQSMAHEGNVRLEDASQAMLRLISRVGSLWTAAEKLDTMVRFDQVPYHSVFISYSSIDEAFATKLFEALKESGVRVWFAPHDIKPGQKIHRQIHHAIEEYDKLLLVLSEASMKSDWVGTELYKARHRERQQDVQMLFPVRLVPFERIREWSAFDADSGRDLAREIREYFIPDFTNWNDDDAFGREFGRLRDALLMTQSEEGVPPATGGAQTDPVRGRQ